MQRMNSGSAGRSAAASQRELDAVRISSEVRHKLGTLPLHVLVGGSLLALAFPAEAQTSTDAAARPAIEEIVVTAQKRSQPINSVGMSIAALSADALLNRGVVDTRDLEKVVPGFTYAQTPYSTPVYTLRGVGVYESGFASSPAVSVYVDEVALPYPYFQKGAALDLERVEVLKGPQGTLFGQNTTGGAINYIAAKPTDHFAAGSDVSAEEYGRFILNGYVSGPLADTLRGRLAFASRQGGAWQKSVSRPDDELGDEDFIQARVLLDWEPTDALSVRINVNGSHDGSQTQAPQLKAIKPVVLDASLTANAGAYLALTGTPIPQYYFLNQYNPTVAPSYIPSPIADEFRLADWPTDWGNLERDNTFYQGSIRFDYELSGDLTLTSISAYEHMDIDNFLGFSGTDRPILDVRTEGELEAFNQEVRLAGHGEALDWVVGAAYDYTRAEERTNDRVGGLELSLLPLDRIYHLDYLVASVDQTVDTYGVFGNVEYRFTEQLTAHAGARYTDSRHRGENCNYEPPGPNPHGTVNEAGQAFSVLSFALRNLVGLPPMPVALQPGDCLNLTVDTFLPGRYYNKLDEDNVSWRVGVNYKFDNDVLLYLTDSRGFKAGVITGPSASSNAQYLPAKQERIDAYEVGFKAPLFDGRAQLNGAAFWYDYQDKQVRTRLHDPVFQQLEAVRNVPESEVKGIELSLEARPFEGLATTIEASYLESEVTGPFYAVGQKVDFTPAENIAATGDPSNPTRNYEGSDLPFTPKYNLTADAEYGWTVFGNKRAFFGGSVVHHGKTNATFSTDEFPAPDFTLPAYTTLDVRAGLGALDGRWRVMLYGRNVTDEYYINAVFDNNDERYAYTGLPTAYGVTVSFRLD